MENEQKPQGETMRGRKQRLKKVLLLTALVWMIFPVGLCVVLFDRVEALNRKLEEMQVQRLEEMMSLQEQDDGTGGQIKRPDRKDAVVENPVSGGDVQEGDPAKPEAAHKVYLTFDDGPSKYTEDILDILDTYDVKATFFVLGKDTDYSIEMLQEIARRGHTIGMHSYTHKYADVYRSVEDFSADFYQIYSYILENTGIHSSCYRFPGGSSNTISDIDMHEFADFLAEQGIEYYDWNISSGDGGSVLLDVDTLVKNATSGIAGKETSIILMHDAASRPTTVEALPRIIESILAMEDTVILPITEETTPIHHIK